MDSEGHSLLHLCMIGPTDSVIDIVKCIELLSSGKETVDANHLDKHGCSALHCALSSGVLSTGYSAKCAGQCRITADNTCIFDTVVEAGADIGYVNAANQTLLHAAAIGGCSSICEHLISHGLNINGADKDGWTPLHHAARHGHVPIIELLLENNANLGAKDTAGHCPLHHAVLHGWENASTAILQTLYKRNKAEQGKILSNGY